MRQLPWVGLGPGGDNAPPVSDEARRQALAPVAKMKRGRNRAAPFDNEDWEGGYCRVRLSDLQMTPPMTQPASAIVLPLTVALPL